MVTSQFTVSQSMDNELHTLVNLWI